MPSSTRRSASGRLLAAWHRFGRRAVFTGDAARTLVMLQHAEEVTGRRLAANLTDQITRAIEEKRLLNAELNPPTA